jgi:hypothetical protein
VPQNIYDQNTYSIAGAFKIARARIRKVYMKYFHVARDCCWDLNEKNASCYLHNHITDVYQVHPPVPDANLDGDGNVTARNETDGTLCHAKNHAA